jgi:hypothetical protein
LRADHNPTQHVKGGPSHEIPLTWRQENQATDTEGFLHAGKDAYDAEMKELAKLGCPDTELAEFVDQNGFCDPPHLTANVTGPMAAWLRNEVSIYSYPDLD